MKTWWNTLAPHARLAFLAACAVLLLVSGAAGWWLLRGDPAVLFSELREQDAATLAGELEKLKIPYSVADQGRTLLVDRSQVHAARMKLMGRDLPLHGTVGFEVFNNSDFGMTEFAQKINYQRALQGELTRTILAFAAIRDARVHLALPEQGLFRQNTARPKAAITLTLRAGQALRGEQVSGIQRLVAAAVPGLQAQEVTIVDQRGVALTRIADAEAEAAGGLGAARLELKREMENYLARKAAAVLDQAFGAGQALASVDLVLDMDQVRVTTEDVLPASDARGGPATGVLVREKESARDSASPDARTADARGTRGSSVQRDVEYQAGRRVEQVVSQPGAVRRIQVVAVVRQALAAEQREQVQKLVAAAVGASAERGDTVVVQALLPAAAAAMTVPAPEPLPTMMTARPAASPTEPIELADFWGLPAMAASLALALLALLALLWSRHRRSGPRHPELPRLTQAQREAALQQVRGWILEASATPTAAPSPQRGRSA
ncbi:MAG TPA: flagellar basal-body MS-ring/collar protein FliF [Ramlibacter sp.]|uniref:flagellar basal-body MS-ring/collar protein FliF n=1 Tax=Ramlibacter sp. TaxID=1917967 RepID=UPI002D7E78F5|nr:flagellar basal-body MS-ring/collar protein FliF [Ramlibacter sp.]HET8748744.1 flagellar basal-body MS-ring/collar protein FliF [Ramlibacter sp.]